jgi:hypothetical protein
MKMDPATTSLIIGLGQRMSARVLKHLGAEIGSDERRLIGNVTHDYAMLIFRRMKHGASDELDREFRHVRAAALNLSAHVQAQLWPAVREAAIDTLGINLIDGD